MRRFEFRLERVLHYKQQRQKLAEIHQKKAAAVLKMVDDEIADLQERLTETAALLSADEGRGSLSCGPLATWLACQAQALQIGRAIEAAEVKAQKARLLLQEANARRRQADIEAEGILTLRHRQWQVYQKQCQRQQQEQVDEIALRRWRTAEDEEMA